MWQPPRKELTGAELSELKENLKVEIKALLCSAKDGLTERELKKEYRDYQGCNLPFTTLGYNTLYDLMKDLKDVCTIEKAFGNWVFFPVHDQTTIRLGTLIYGQKDEKRSVRNRSRFNEGQRRSFYNNNSNMPNNLNSGYQSNVRSSKPIVNVIPHITSDIQEEIVQVLKKSSESCLTRAGFEQEYKRAYGFVFNFIKLGFSTLRQALESLDHIIKIKPDGGVDYSIELVHKEEKQPSPNKIKDDKKAAEPTVTIPQSLEEETLSNLKKIMISVGESGIFLSDLLDAYREFTGKDITFEKFGYNNFEQFVFEKMSSFVQIDVNNASEPKLYNETFGLKKPETNSKYSDSSSSEADDVLNKANETKLLQLKELIVELLDQQTTDKIPLDKFFTKFEEYYGWKLDHRDYELKDKDELTSEMIQQGFITIEVCNHLNKHFDYMIICPPKKPLLEKPQTRERKISEATTNFNENEESYQNATAEFMKAYILKNKELSDSDDVLIKLATNKSHTIIVSNVVNPCNIQVQLAENINALNTLMMDLEEVYYGLGASNFNMPDSYIEHGDLCAAIYPHDKNWHRCRITGIFTETKKARVYFIDYGGESVVSLDDVKFLSRDFAYLPVQAVNARFANIAEPVDGKWPKDIVNYLLNRVTQHKPLYADVIGFNDGFVSLEIYYYAECNEGKDKCKISLNNRIVQDGFGSRCVEKDEVEFNDFETWQKIMLEKSINKAKAVETCSNADTFDKKLEKAYQNYVYTSSSSINQSPKLKETPANERQKSSQNTSKIAAEQLEYDTSISVFEKEKSFVATKPSQIVKKPSHKDRFKVKEIVYLDPNTSVKYYLNLIEIDGQIFVHWTEVATIFGLSDQVFKGHLKMLDSTYKYSDHLLVQFVNNDKNEDIFDYVTKWVNIDLFTIEETDTLWMLKYKQLYKIAEICLSPIRAESVKNFLRNNKFVKKSNKSNGKENMSYYPNIEKVKLTSDLQLSPNTVQLQIDRLIPNCHRIKETLQLIGEKDIVQCQKLIEEFENLREKIEFCERHLKPCNNI